MAVGYTDMNETIFRDLYGIKKCPKMFIRGEITYYSVETYLNGYIRGLEHCSGIKLHEKIMHWYLKRISQKSSCFFTAYVEIRYKEKSEEERICILIDLIVAFFQENPSWYQ